MDNCFVVLLRGVNVGGSRRVLKQEFVDVLKAAGCEQVHTYINSGNAVVSAAEPLTVDAVQEALESHFKFEIPTLMLPAAQAVSIAQAIPAHWTNDPPRPDKSGYKSDVLYLFDDIDSPEVLDTMGYRPEIETMHYLPGAVVTSISRANQSRGSLQKVIGTKLYGQMTVRNINTARKLAELVTHV